jgi:hypothetical protein
VAFLVVAPAISLFDFYRSQEAAGNTNDQVLAVHDVLLRQYQAGSISEVLIDPSISGELVRGGANAARSEDYLFTLDGVPHRSMRVTPAALNAEMAKSSGRSVGLIVLTQEYQALSLQARLSALGEGLAHLKYGAYVAQQ